MSATDSKVDLMLTDRHRKGYQAPDHKTERVTKCLPFYRRGPLRLVHRVREAWLFYRQEKFSHMAVQFWCGNVGYMGGKPKRGGRGDDRPSLFAVAPEHAMFCATCEGRAVGAGMDGARKINGRPVLFQPRELKRKIHWHDEPTTPPTDDGVQIDVPVHRKPGSPLR